MNFSRRVLVVDDERTVRCLTALAFERQGYHCDQAADGVEADDRLADVRYDVLITDLRMPNRHGYSLLTEVLCLLEKPLLVVYTGVDDPRMVRSLLDRGVDEVVQKPIDLNLFVAKVGKLLDERMARLTVG